MPRAKNEALRAGGPSESSPVPPVEGLLPSGEVLPRELAPGETLAEGLAPEGVTAARIDAPDLENPPAAEPEQASARMTELGPRPAGTVLGSASDGEPVGEVQVQAPVSVQESMHRFIEPGYVPPEMRRNLDYQARAAAQCQQEEKNLAAARPGWGFERPRIIGASPNMAKQQINVNF